MTAKNSFLLYCDQAEMVDELSNEQAGILLKAIYRFACDKTFPANISDPVVRIAFISIKTAIDRDSIKYSEKCLKNQENGKKGGRPKRDEADTPCDQNETERIF